MPSHVGGLSTLTEGKYKYLQPCVSSEDVLHTLLMALFLSLVVYTCARVDRSLISHQLSPPLSGHIKPTPAACAQEMQEAQAPCSLLGSELIPSAQGQGPDWGWGGGSLNGALSLSSWDCSGYFFWPLSCPALVVQLSSASIGG